MEEIQSKVVAARRLIEALHAGQVKLTDGQLTTSDEYHVLSNDIANLKEDLTWAVLSRLTDLAFLQEVEVSGADDARGTTSVDRQELLAFLADPTGQSKVPVLTRPDVFVVKVEHRVSPPKALSAFVHVLQGSTVCMIHAFAPSRPSNNPTNPAGNPQLLISGWPKTSQAGCDPDATFHTKLSGSRGCGNRVSRDEVAAVVVKALEDPLAFLVAQGAPVALLDKRNSNPPSPIQSAVPKPVQWSGGFLNMVVQLQNPKYMAPACNVIPVVMGNAGIFDPTKANPVTLTPGTVTIKVW